MPTPHNLYEQFCSNLKLPTDIKITKALNDICHSGELNIAGLSVTSQTCDILSKVLTQSKDIVKLNVSDCLLPPQGLAALLSKMHLTNINTLQLRGNNIGGPSIGKLSKMLSRSVNIKNVGLEWNNLGLCSDGFSHFCEALATSRSLEVLDLRNNQLDEECAALLAGALRKNTSLRALDVRWNAIVQMGGQHFLTALHANKTLTAIKIQGNSLTNDLLTAIEQCVQHNGDLLRLESGYEARQEVLTNHVRAVTSQRAQELRDWADKSQRQVEEMNIKVKEVQGILSSKQAEMDELVSALAAANQRAEAVQVRAMQLQEQLSLQEERLTAVVRDYQLQLDTLNKALAANKCSLSSLEEKLTEERELRDAVEREREKDKEKINRLEQEINKKKEEIQNIITDQIDAVEQERRQSQQRLALASEEWGNRLEQRAAEHARAEQVYRDRVRAVETALEEAERRQAELSAQWGTERARWSEEKANIWAEAKEKESCKVLLLTEKVEHLKEEKASLETQLSVANTTSQQLQRDNSSAVADLSELRRKLSTVQEELSTERLLTQKLRSEKAEDLRTLDSVRAELTSVQRAVTEASAGEEELRRKIRRLTSRLEDQERHISSIRKEEKDRAGLLVAAIKNYIDQVNLTSS